MKLPQQETAETYSTSLELLCHLPAEIHALTSLRLKALAEDYSLVMNPSLQAMASQLLQYAGDQVM